MTEHNFTDKSLIEIMTNDKPLSADQQDDLIERAQQMFPGNEPGQKVKAMNFLLPYIRRTPDKADRDRFAAAAAQKLGIDAGALKEQFKQMVLSHVPEEERERADKAITARLERLTTVRGVRGPSTLEEG